MKGGDLLSMSGAVGGGKKRRYKTGKRKVSKKNKTRRRKTRTMKGGNAISTAILPFGLLTLQQFFQNRTRKNKKMISSGFKNVKKSLKL